MNQPEGLVGAARALVEGGVAAVEVTMTTPGALDVIASTRKELGEDVLIGAGTVLTPADARRAVAAGASFLVAPTINSQVIQIAHDAGLSVTPGALTPNEIQRALELEADLIKLFPGQVATPGYFKDILGPFPSAKLLPTGNVNLETLPGYIRAGAVAVGVGKALVDADAIRREDWDDLRARAMRYSSAVQAARTEL
jgi:2-dehydro-3-deoxyphosphogluconate aldolase/(4S)-4-hydroxy-2-oxoglutarate aldolase